MNHFIHASNQSTLWKVINNVAQVQHFFANAPPGAKEKWFQTHIGQIYQLYYGKSEALQSLNKKAIDIMLGSLVQPHVQQPPSKPTIQQPLKQPQVMQLPGQAIKSATMDEFSRRQAEYEAMVTKHTPVANFSEPIKDEAISDLNSAVEQYKKMREPIELQIEEIGDTREIDSGDTKIIVDTSEIKDTRDKRVKWSSTNQEHDHFETRILNAIANIEKDIADIKAFLRVTNISKENPI